MRLVWDTGYMRGTPGEPQVQTLGSDPAGQTPASAVGLHQKNCRHSTSHLGNSSTGIGLAM